MPALLSQKVILKDTLGRQLSQKFRLDKEVFLPSIQRHAISVGEPDAMTCGYALDETLGGSGGSDDFVVPGLPVHPESFVQCPSDFSEFHESRPPLRELDWYVQI